MIHGMVEQAAKPLEPINWPADELMQSAMAVAADYFPKEMHTLRRPLGFRVRPLLPKARERLQERCRLAIIMAAHFGLEPNEIGRMMYDSRFFSCMLQRFVDHFGRSAFKDTSPTVVRDVNSDPGKVMRLSLALKRSVMKSSDNEMFVIMADLLSVVDELGPLLDVIRLATSRHHRVAIVCSWPENLPIPRTKMVSRAIEEIARDAKLPPLEMLEQVQDNYRVRQFMALKGNVARLRVPLVCVTDAQAIRLILTQIQLTKTGRIASRC